MRGAGARGGVQYLAEHGVSVRRPVWPLRNFHFNRDCRERCSGAIGLASLALEEAAHGIEDVFLGGPVSIVAIVGNGMRSTRGIAARFCGALSESDINIIAMTKGASEMSISVAVDAERAVDAIRAVHAEFGLTDSKQVPLTWLILISSSRCRPDRATADRACSREAQ